MNITFTRQWEIFSKVDNMEDAAEKRKYKVSDEYEEYLISQKSFDTDSALELIRALPLVKGANGLISAAKTLESCDSEETVSVIQLIAKIPRRVLVKLASDNWKDIITPLVPIWPMIHKLDYGVQYKEWSLDEADGGEVAFGDKIYEGITKYDTYALEHAEMVEKVMGDSYNYQEDTGKNSFVPSGILILPKDGVSKGAVPDIPNRVILGMWYANKENRNEYMITNYDDLDTYPND